MASNTSKLCAAMMAASQQMHVIILCQVTLGCNICSPLEGCRLSERGHCQVLAVGVSAAILFAEPPRGRSPELPLSVTEDRNIT
jgi:hypothetical protein